jgi:hypothetical protein
MGSITERKRKDGTTGYRAEVVRKRAGNVVLKLTETCDRRKAAQDWIAGKEKAVEKPGGARRRHCSQEASAVIDAR